MQEVLTLTEGFFGLVKTQRVPPQCITFDFSTFFYFFDFWGTCYLHETWSRNTLSYYKQVFEINKKKLNFSFSRDDVINYVNDCKQSVSLMKILHIKVEEKS